MVHTMLIFLQQLDMQLLGLLPCTIIQARVMAVSSFKAIHVKCMPLVLIDASVFSFLCWSGGESTRGMGKKIFVGRLPQEATSEDLRQYFGRFGRILDVYVPRVRELHIILIEMWFKETDGFANCLWHRTLRELVTEVLVLWHSLKMV